MDCITTNKVVQILLNCKGGNSPTESLVVNCFISNDRQPPNSQLIVGEPTTKDSHLHFYSIASMPTSKKTLAAADKPPASLNGAQWISSPAKHLMTQDMLDGLVPVSEKVKNIFRLWVTMYAHQPEFKDFPYEESRFKSRLEALQKSIGRLAWAARYDNQCLLQAKAAYPDPTHGPTGVPLWRDSDAAKQLDHDMAWGLHETMTPSELRATNLEVYGPFTKKRFAKMIDQKREASKPYGANPMQAAAKKAAKDKKRVRNRPEISRIAAAGVNAYVNEE